MNIQLINSIAEAKKRKNWEIMQRKHDYNFSKAKVCRGSIDKPIYDKDGNLIASCASVGMKVTYVIGRLLKDATDAQIKQYAEAQKKVKPGWSKQPARIGTSLCKPTASKKLTHIDYLHGIAMHRLQKWDLKHPAPDTKDIDALSPYEKEAYVKHWKGHRQMRSDMFSKIVTELMTRERRKKNRYKVAVYKLGDAYTDGKPILYFNKVYSTRNTAQKDFIEQSLKAKRELKDNFYRSDLIEIGDKFVGGFNVIDFEQGMFKSSLLSPIEYTCNIPEKNQHKIKPLIVENAKKLAA